MNTKNVPTPTQPPQGVMAPAEALAVIADCAEVLRDHAKVNRARLLTEARDTFAALLARCEGLEAFVRELASGGLRFDLTPTHDMSSLNTAEQFWHDYARRMDESIRERATEFLAATRTTGD